MNQLGEYLRARREQLTPDEVGLPELGRRRTPGLRREELAMLAGISADYYLRLEQGRDTHPSDQVLDALARALRLDDDASGHLHSLAKPVRRRKTARRPEKAPAGLLRLIENWPGTPAVVQGRYSDVLAANGVAQALSPIYRPGTNAIRTLFLDPGMRELYPEWEQMGESTVAGLRALVGPDVDDPRLVELVGELSVRSEWFRRLWARHDVRKRVGGGLRSLHHPQVGPLELRYEKLGVTDAEGQTLVIYHAEPGSPSAERLALLATLAEPGPHNEKP